MHVEVLIQQRVPLGRPIIVQLHKGAHSLYACYQSFVYNCQKTHIIQ